MKFTEVLITSETSGTAGDFQLIGGDGVQVNVSGRYLVSFSFNYTVTIENVNSQEWGIFFVIGTNFANEDFSFTGQNTGGNTVFNASAQAVVDILEGQVVSLQFYYNDKGSRFTLNQTAWNNLGGGGNIHTVSLLLTFVKIAD